MNLYTWAHRFVGPLAKFLFPVTATGTEKIPAEGGVILCANHTSLLDPIMIGVCTKRERQIHFMAKEELFKNKLLGRLARALGAFPVNRGGNDMSAVRESMKILKEGRVLGIFPQGTRAKNGVQPPMLPGCALIAIRSGAPVYPIYIDRKFRLFRRSRIVIGDALDTTGIERRVDNAALQAFTARIEDAVWSLGKK